MYAALWRALPRPIWVKVVILLVIVAVLLVVLATWVFPWVDQVVNGQDVTVGAPASAILGRIV